MTVALFYLAKPRTGGWPTFTAHLALGLGDAQIFRVTRRSEKSQRPFGRGLGYQNVDLESALAIAQTFPSIITATDKHYAEVASPLAPLCATVVHDPTELKLPHLAHLGTTIVIRQTMCEYLPGATFIRHPYQRDATLKPLPPKSGAVAISRVDFDKRTRMICEANDLGAAIHIHGTENPIYTHFDLDEKVPGWRDWYRGPFPVDDLWAGAKICADAKAMVDLSVISGDGGGSQYTFLEALDAGAALVLHREWKPVGPLAEIACTVDTPRDLVDAVDGAVPPGSEADALLEAHDAVAIASRFRELAASLPVKCRSGGA